MCQVRPSRRPCGSFLVWSKSWRVGILGSGLFSHYHNLFGFALLLIRVARFQFDSFQHIVGDQESDSLGQLR